MVGCLQVQPIETIPACSDVQPKVGREQVPMICDTARTTVGPLGERLFLAVPAQAGLGQGGSGGAELVETVPAGACSLAANRLHEQPGCPVPHAAREGLLPSHVIELLASNGGAIAEQSVGQAAMQRLAVLSQPAMQFNHSRLGAFGTAGPLPGATAGGVDSVRAKAAGRAGAVLPVQVPLDAPQPGGVQSDPISQRLNPPRPGSVASFDDTAISLGPRSNDTRPSPTGCLLVGCPPTTSCMR